MTDKNIIIVLLIAVITGTIIYARSVNINLPGNNQGYAPVQPIAFSHRLHAGDLQITCLYCHTGVDKSRHAGIPPASICMNCHRFVTDVWDRVQIAEKKAADNNEDIEITVSNELTKLYDAAGFNTEIMQYDSSASGQSLEWIRVYSLPAFTYFDHARHVNAGVICQQCHGRVETMERISQETDLSMGWCVNCHRDANNGKLADLVGSHATTNCTACHY